MITKQNDLISHGIKSCNELPLQDFLNLFKQLEHHGANKLPHSGNRSLAEHLWGTLEILQRWSQNSTLCKAGLFHSCYSTDVYRHGMFNPGQRDKVRALIGKESEELVFTFCTIDRKDLSKKLNNLKFIPDDGLAIKNFRSGQSEQISKNMIAELIILEMANIADQSTNEGEEPALWLSKIVTLGRIGRPFFVYIPPVLDNLTYPLTPEDEALSWKHYTKGVALLRDDIEAAYQELENSIILNPWVGEPRLLFVLAKLLLCDFENLSVEVQKALGSLQTLGTSWDKRRTWHHWIALGEWLRHMAREAARRPFQIKNWLAANESIIRSEPFRLVGLKMTLPQSQPAASDPGKKYLPDLYGETGSKLELKDGERKLEGWPRFETYIKSFLENRDNAAMLKYPGLFAKPFHQSADYQAAAVLENAYSIIKKEFYNIVAGGGFQAEMEPIKRTGSWNVFMLFEKGVKNVKNCEKCPETVRIIESIPSVRTHLGLAYFSVMAPRTHIQAHRGPTNMRIRCHLGLEIPKDCGIRVCNENKSWQEGKCLIFDDSLDHEVWNDSNKKRIVLIVDLWHPDLTAIEVRALEGLYRYIRTSNDGTDRYLKRNEEGRARFLDTMHWM